MGTTCASFHFRARTAADAAKAVARAYTAQGYRRDKKPQPGGKRVIVLARPNEPFISVLDSTNAELDSGELKDAALTVSRLLKTAAVFTSVYDSDSFECVLFCRGRQLDALMTDAESYDGPLKMLKGKPRATQWGSAFYRSFAPGQIDAAAAPAGAFAEASLGAVAHLIGLPGERIATHFNDVADAAGPAVTNLWFTKVAAPAQPEIPGSIVLRNYFDRHNSRKLMVYPAAWPMPVGKEEILTWLMLSEGGGFSGGTLKLSVTGPGGLSLTRGFLNGAKFHNGQIVGGYELPSDTTAEAAKAYVETKRFDLTPADSDGSGRRYRADYPNLYVPPMTPQRTTQILLVLQIHVLAAAEGEWDIAGILSPGGGEQPRHKLPGVKLAAIVPDWQPIVSALNPQAPYSTEDLPEPPLPDATVDLLLQHRWYNAHFHGMTPEAARARRRELQAAEHPRQYATWLREVGSHQPRIALDRRLFHPSVASTVAILADAGQASLDLCRSAIEAWLRPALARAGTLQLRAERRMTEAGNVTRLRKSWPLREALQDKAWPKLFDAAQPYQAVMLTLVPEGDEIPVAGLGLHATLSERGADPLAAEGAGAIPDLLLAMTLGKMRGRAFAPVARGETLHLYRWVTNHPACLAFAGVSTDSMKQDLDALAAAHRPLQAWHGEAAWLPVFDTAGDYEDTVYEDYSVLNFFRGILHDEQLSLKALRLSAGWCGNVLRMVTPHLWLGPGLAAQVDGGRLGRVADVSEVNGCLKVVKKAEASMEDLEIALLPILPIESARVTVTGETNG
jgi:hypothetical protein